jgi:WD40 repeat protein
LVASGSYDEPVRLWDAVRGGPLQTLDGYWRRVNPVAFSPDSKLVASGSDDSTVRFWDTATAALLQTLKGHSSAVNSVAFSPDGKLVPLSVENGRRWRMVGAGEEKGLEKKRLLILAPIQI